MITTNKHSKETIAIAKTIVTSYANYSQRDNLYVLDTNKVPDFDLSELAASIIQDDALLASEATGADNPAYTTTMLPALLDYLKNSTDKDTKIEFLSAWREGVTSYCEDIIEEILEEELYQMNCDLLSQDDSYYEEQRAWL